MTRRVLFSIIRRSACTLTPIFSTGDRLLTDRFPEFGVPVEVDGDDNVTINGEKVELNTWVELECDGTGDSWYVTFSSIHAWGIQAELIAARDKRRREENSGKAKAE